MIILVNCIMILWPFLKVCSFSNLQFMLCMEGVDTDHVIFCDTHCISGVNSGIGECQTWSFGIWKALVVIHFKALLSNLPGDSKDKEIKRNRGDLVWLGFELDSSLVWSGDTSAMQACTKRKFILGCCTVWSGRWLPGFQRNLLPPS